MTEADLIHEGWRWWECIPFTIGKAWGFVSNPQPPFPVIRFSKLCDPNHW